MTNLLTFHWKKTYKWYDDSKIDRNIDQLLQRRLIFFINRELKNDGYQLVGEGEEADFLVNYVVVSKERQEIQSYYTYSPYYYGYRGAPSNTQVVMRNYRMGTLFIDILSARTGNLVWRGVGTRRIPQNMDRLRRNEISSEIVSEVMKQFPPDPRDKPVTQ